MTLLVAIVLGLGFALAIASGRRSAPISRPDPAAMDPEAAYRHAVELSLGNERRESLPYFRRGLEGEPGREWRPHFNYGIVLNDLTLQFVRRAGRQVPASRSSAERIELGCAALDEFGAAVKLAPDGATRAKILSLRANMLLLWGFPWEALACFRAAQQADTTRADLAIRADQFFALMRDPASFRFVQPDSSTRLAMP